MHTFDTVLENINKRIYKPNQLIVASIEEEPQNLEYAACKFELLNQATIKTVRFRVAKKTPTKVGQFVTFWEKDSKGINQPFEYDESPELLVVTTFYDKIRFGQFVFPKRILLDKDILKSSTTKGKMGIRVYPNWDEPLSKTAKNTQSWQLDYFFEIDEEDDVSTREILRLYKL